MDFDDHYQTLGVSPDASALDIRKAYRQLVLELHPDRNPGDGAAEERFKKVSSAYRVLSNSLRRADYDQQYLLHRPRPVKPEPPPSPEPERRPRTRTKDELEERRREKRRREEEAKLYTQYDSETNELEGRDFINGIIAGTLAAFLFGEIYLKHGPEHSSWTLLLWSLAPALGAPLGYRLGEIFGALFERRLEALSDVIPLIEAGVKLFPVIGATGSACGMLLLSRAFDLELSAAGLFPGALAGGIASALGSAFGRAFTSVSTSLPGKLFGIAVALVVGTVTGGLLGAGCAAARVGPFFGVPLYDVIACAAIGGAIGGALASALGAWLGSGTAQVIDLREQRRR